MKLAKWFILLISAVGCYGQTCSLANGNGIANGVDFLEHGQVRVQFTCTFTATQIRFDLGPTNNGVTAACPSSGNACVGTYGASSITTGYLLGYVLQNLTPGNVYFGNAQGFDGSAWHSAGQFTFTAPSLPTIHPVFPDPPFIFTTSVPIPTGTTWCYNIGSPNSSTCPGAAAGSPSYSSCGFPASSSLDFQDCLNKAVFGDEIIITPANSPVIPLTAVGAGSFFLHTTPNGIAITVNGGTGVITCTTSCGSLANGSAVRFGFSFGATPAPIQSGQTYCVTGLSGTSFSVGQGDNNPANSSCASPGSTITAFTDVSGGPYYVVPWPPATVVPVYIHSSDMASLPPAGVRLDGTLPTYAATYQTHMAVFKSNAAFNAGNTNNALIQSRSPSMGTGAMSHDYYFAGVEFDSPNLAGTPPLTTTDPPVEQTFLGFEPQNYKITFDRVFFNGPLWPNRAGKWIGYWNGAYMSLQNWSGMGSSWVPQFPASDGAVSATSTVASIGAFTAGYYLGTSAALGLPKCTSPAASITLTGGSASAATGYIYFDLSCNLKARIPNGVTFTTANITVVQQATPALPVDGNGNLAAGAIGQLGFSGATFNAGFNYANGGWSSKGVGDAQQYILVGGGSGPAQMINGHGVAPGIIYHGSGDGSGQGWCSGCSQIYTFSDFVVSRTTFDANPTSFLTGAGGQWLRYPNRNPYENKTVNRELFIGNNVTGSYQDINAGWCALLMNSNGNALTTTGVSANNLNQTSNIEASYNRVWNCGGAGFVFGAQSPGIYQKSAPSHHAYTHDNVLWNSNGWNLANPATWGTASSGSTYGMFVQMTNAAEDMRYVHNTHVCTAGTIPAQIGIEGGINEGWLVSNNLLLCGSNDSSFFGFQLFDPNGGGGFLSNPSCTGAGSAGYGCGTNWTWTHNVMGCGYANSQTNTSIGTGTCGGFAASYPNDLFTTGTNQATWLSSVGFNNIAANNYQLLPVSPYVSGGVHNASDGLNMGADIEGLIAAQGIVQNVHVWGVTTTGANIGWVAPDGFDCTVDINGARVDGSNTVRSQSVTVTGLTTHTTYPFKVNCAAVQPTGSLTTN